MNKYTVIAISVVVAVSLWWTFIYQRNLREEAKCELAKSDGTLDSHAKNALRVLDKLNRPTGKDRFLAARVIDLNGYEGRINNVRVLDDVVGRYMDNLLDDEGLDWFEIDQIEQFADRHRDIIDANDRYQEFRETVNQKRPTMLGTTIADAKAKAANRSEAFTTYVEGSVAHTDDPQNVHDSAVNTQLRKTYEKLVETTPPSLLAAAAAELSSKAVRHLDSAISDPGKRQRAGKALNTMLQGHYNATLDANEKDLLALVWARSCMGENRSNKNLMRDAFAEALQDMGGNEGADGVVCSGGRCARLLESLLFTDQDDDAVKGVMTTEQIRNDVMERSSKLLQSSIEEFASPNSSDLGLATAAKAYVDPTIEVASSDEIRFKTVVKDKINAMIQQEYSEKLAAKDLANIHSHCIAAIDSM